MRSHAVVARIIAPLTIVLAEPHDRLRAAIAALLDHEPGMRVVASAGTAAQAASAMRRARPDVLVADWSLTSPSGCLLARWGPVDSGVPIVVTGFESPDAMTPRLLARGAAAYVSKERLSDELPPVLRRVGAARAADVGGQVI